MKIIAKNYKIVIITLFFLILFSWWYINVYQIQNNSGFNVPLDCSTNGKLVFGKPDKAGIVELEYTGFISGFDSVTKNPLWVAYPLKSVWLKDAKLLAERDFKPDPSLPVHWMADLNDYKKSGYDRGHLARQSDMRGRSLLCEQEACYLTNISPQISQFNQKTWLNLENAVQKWAVRYDSLWVITGPWFDQKREFLKHNTEIPDGFYKIVIRYQDNRLSLISFLFKQTDRDLDLNSYLVPVDSIEKLTKIDFFSKLPDLIENRVEQLNYKIWPGWR